MQPLAGHRTTGGLCPLCDSGNSHSFFERPKIPISANIVYATREAALGAPGGALDLRLCGFCGFVFNRAFDPGLHIYCAGYDNDQTFSEEFGAHMNFVAARVRRAVPGELKVLEVGCGQGQFLDALMAEGSEGIGIGFDPSLRRASTERLRLVPKYLDFESASEIDFEPNVAVSRHVIEHVPRPVEFLRVIRKALPAEALLFLETPCVTHILETGAFWDFCYEHCSYFSAETLRAACERAGFAVSAVERMFAGQYLLLEGRAAMSRESRRAAPPLAAAERFRAQVETLRERWRDAIGQARRRGRVAVWGAGTKGAGFVQLVDPDATLVHALIDINPRKHGRFLAGTGHPIVDWRAAIADGVRTAAVMNANYLSEIRKTVAEAGAPLELLAVETGG